MCFFFGGEREREGGRGGGGVDGRKEGTFYFWFCFWGRLERWCWELAVLVYEIGWIFLFVWSL